MDYFIYGLFHKNPPSKKQPPHLWVHFQQGYFTTNAGGFQYSKTISMYLSHFFFDFICYQFCYKVIHLFPSGGKMFCYLYSYIVQNEVFFSVFYYRLAAYPFRGGLKHTRTPFLCVFQRCALRGTRGIDRGA